MTEQPITGLLFGYNFTVNDEINGRVIVVKSYNLLATSSNATVEYYFPLRKSIDKELLEIRMLMLGFLRGKVIALSFPSSVYEEIQRWTEDNFSRSNTPED